jgi:hypothetical protein
MPLLNKSHRTTNDADTRANSASPERKKGIFASRRASASPSDHSSKRAGRGLFSSRRRNKSRSIDHDPSIINARQKVSDAERSEKDADRALMEARKHVQLAREHVQKLEREATEE